MEYIRIKWMHAIETIPLNLRKKPIDNEIVATQEYWPTSDVVVEYKTTSKRKRDGNGNNIIAIYYKEENNRHLSNSYGDADLLWGKTIIKFQDGARQGTAEWQSDSPSADLDGETYCTIISEELYAEEEREVISRRKKKQAQFKDDLLALDGRCAITNETMREILDAAHIVDAKYNGRESASNGILLRTDIHRMFDAAIFTIESDGSIKLLASAPDYCTQILKDTIIEQPIMKRISRALEDRKKLRGQ